MWQNGCYTFSAIGSQVHFDNSIRNHDKSIYLHTIYISTDIWQNGKYKKVIERMCSQTNCVKLCVGVSGPRSCVCSQQQACTASEDNILQTQPAVAQVGHSLHYWVISSLI